MCSDCFSFRRILVTFAAETNDNRHVQDIIIIRAIGQLPQGDAEGGDIFV